MKTFKELVLDEGTKAEYQAFFNKKLKKFGVKSQAELSDEEKKKFYNDSGQPSKFYQEYMMEVQSLEDALFTRELIKYWKGYYAYDAEENQNYLVISGERVPVNTFIGCDPATDIDTKESDFSVILSIAIDVDNNLYALEYERHRSIPTIGAKDVNGNIIDKKGVVDFILEMHEKYHCISSTVEDVAMNRSIFQAMNEISM